MSGNQNGEDPEMDNSLHRVKVYRLNQGGNWDDKGTGLITVQNLEQSAALGLIVMEEEQPTKTLLIHRMSKDLVYQRQDDTIISWQDQEAASDIAISFQEAPACHFIWEEIQREQQRHGGMYGKRAMIDEIDGPQPTTEEMSNGYPDVPVELPAPELGNLEQISSTLRSLSVAQKDQVASLLTKDSALYARKILDCFRTAEDLEDASSLVECFHILRCMILLNESDLLEHLFSEQNVMDMVGALEYDPNLPEQGKFRNFLRDTVIFKEPVPIRSPDMKAKIHQTYRLGYVRDVILPRVIDEGTFATISSLMVFNNVEVLMGLIAQKEVFQDLVTQFRMATPGSEHWVDIICFLSELATLSKHLTNVNQGNMFDTLVALGLFEILTNALKYGDEKVQGKATDVLLMCLQVKPHLLREYLVGPVPKEEPPKNSRIPIRRQLPKFNSALFNILIRFLTEGAPVGIQEQVVEILRNLLASSDFDKNVFLDTFYSKYMPQLMTVIEKGCDKKLNPGEGPSPQALNLAIEVLCYCIYNHQYRIKYYILNQHVMEKIVKVLQRPEKWLQCAAIRFIRACLSLKDDFYNRYMVRVNLFEPIISVFVANGEKYNLLNSVILELFNFIYINSIRNLIDYFMATQYHRVEDVDYDKTFQLLKTKWDQMHDASTETGVASDQLNASRLQKDPRALDRDEESYFNEADDDEETVPLNDPKFTGEGIARGLPLVDYDDEELPSPRGRPPPGEELFSRDSTPKRMKFEFSSSPPLHHSEPPNTWRQTQ